MLIPDPFNFVPVIFHDNQKFSQALGIKAVIIGDAHLGPKPELGIDAVPADMDVNRFTRVALVGVTCTPYGER
jgi:hypothetical protein